MNDSPNSFAAYARDHHLAGRYGFGVLLMAAFGLTAFGQGSPALIAAKIIMGGLFAIASAAIPALFDKERSATPFTPSFVERTVLTALCSALAMAGVNWTPQTSAVHTALVAGAVFLGMLALPLVLAKVFPKK